MKKYRKYSKAVVNRKHDEITVMDKGYYENHKLKKNYVGLADFKEPDLPKTDWALLSCVLLLVVAGYGMFWVLAELLNCLSLVFILPIAAGLGWITGKLLGMAFK